MMSEELRFTIWPHFPGQSRHLTQTRAISDSDQYSQAQTRKERERARTWESERTLGRESRGMPGSHPLKIFLLLTKFLLSVLKSIKDMLIRAHWLWSYFRIANWLKLNVSLVIRTSPINYVHKGPSSWKRGIMLLDFFFFFLPFFISIFLSFSFLFPSFLAPFLPLFLSSSFFLPLFPFFPFLSNLLCNL